MNVSYDKVDCEHLAARQWYSRRARHPSQHALSAEARSMMLVDRQ